MMKNFKILAAFLLATPLYYAQKQFDITTASKKYNISITSQNCNKESCDGPGTIKLIDKKTKKTIQSFKSEELSLSFDSNGKIIYDIAVLVNDFNFDGQEDVAVQNGRNGAYGAASYDIYLYQPSNKMFKKDQNFSQILSQAVDFKVNSKKKNITTFSKSGCCVHQTTTYVINSKKQLEKSVEVIENSEDKKYVKVTTGRKVNNKWAETSKKYPAETYKYLEN
ncbi:MULTISPECIES: XAC2610-related protein [Chryseobacterium]|jgi:hypothetical protein|uniref:VCBS repeat protein n=1 Tax=Chryseobacterium geocarposphaerae TaxID=1416776 RepID=A0ABU1LAU8_9FLAO|nr:MULTISPECIES: hypothetical protein [Chryseobacterium]MDR6403843.1 hypothetical protein [Chryseobacterium geocarposphaerae]MDR6698638.1 hypothetical protein [Chryseobacterium ginsenosidimutans]